MANDEFLDFLSKVETVLTKHGINATAVDVFNIANDLFVSAESPHEQLVRAALNDSGRVYGGMYSTNDGFGGPTTTISQWAFVGKKIHAIKRLRWLTNCGLKEAKDAIEDFRFIRGYM